MAASPLLRRASLEDRSAAWRRHGVTIGLSELTRRPGKGFTETPFDPSATALPETDSSGDSLDFMLQNSLHLQLARRSRCPGTSISEQMRRTCSAAGALEPLPGSLASSGSCASRDSLRAVDYEEDIELRLFAALQPDNGRVARQGKPIPFAPEATRPRRCASASVLHQPRTPSLRSEAKAKRAGAVARVRFVDQPQSAKNSIQRQATGFVRFNQAHGLLAALEAAIEDDDSDDSARQGQSLTSTAPFVGCWTDSWREAAILDLSSSAPLSKSMIKNVAATGFWKAKQALQ